MACFYRLWHLVSVMLRLWRGIQSAMLIVFPIDLLQDPSPTFEIRVGPDTVGHLGVRVFQLWLKSYGSRVLGFR